MAFGLKAIFLSLVPGRRPVSSLHANPAISFLLPARAEAALAHLPRLPLHSGLAERAGPARRRTTLPLPAPLTALACLSGLLLLCLVSGMDTTTATARLRSGHTLSNVLRAKTPPPLK